MLNEQRIHRVFQIGVLLKGAHALIECIGGAVLFLVSANAIARRVNSFTQEELIEDPGDLLATRPSDLAQHFSVGSKQFCGFYLVSHALAG
jgi:uncharacterized membrane protein